MSHRTRLVIATSVLIFATGIGLAAAQTPATSGGAVDPALIEDLVAANRILAEEGVLDAYGHVSIRHPSDPNRYLMSRSLAPVLVTASDIKEYDLDSNPIDPRGRRSVIERFIHGEIYKLRPDVKAVIHSHSPAVIPFGVTQAPMRPVIHAASFLWVGVPVWDSRDAQDPASAAMLVRNALGLPPPLGADGVAGKDRPREPRLDAFEPLRPVIGALPQDRARRDAEACRAMQDGTLEAGGLGALGIGVERVLVAVEPVEKREIGRRRQIADFLRRRLRYRMRCRRLRCLAAEPAVLARKRAAVDGGDRRSVLADQVARILDDGGVAGAFVDDLLDARPAHELRLGCQGLMQHHLEVAGDDQALVDAEGGVGHAARPAQHHRHGGKCREPSALVHEFELARIERVHADADAERVENALALTVAHANVAGPVGHDPFVIELRFHQYRLPCPQCATLRPGRERFRAQAPCASLPPDPR